MKSFSDFSLSTVLKANLAKNSFTEPTPIQAGSIEPGIAGNDLVATAQTGTGKTLAFILPLLHRLSLSTRPADQNATQNSNATGRSNIRAVVLSPTRELAIQISEVFTTMSAGTGLRCAVVVGGMGEGPQLRAIRGGAQVVIATPGRLFDYIGRRAADLSKTEVLILDEADRMLDMGFLPTIEKIIGVMPTTRQTLLFSATMDKTVKHLVAKYVKNPVRVEIGSTSKPVESVDLHVYEIEQDRKLGQLESMLKAEQGSFLVFARTKHGADKLSTKLTRAGIKTVAIHGDRSQNQRNQALKGFQDGYYRVMVATDVAARGIHMDAIAHVVNYDMPQAPSDFIHRVGRTGRAGAKGVASTFATRVERRDVVTLERTLGITLIRRQVSVDVPREERSVMEPKHHSAPVVPINKAKAPFAGHGARSPWQSRSFAPKGKKSGRAMRRAV